MDTIKKFIDFITVYPILGTVILIIIGILSFVYRKQIKAYLAYKFKFLKDKKVNKLEMYCDNIGLVFDFKEELIIPDYNSFYKSLTKQINIVRKNNKILKLNFSELISINEYSKEAIRDCLREAILNNNVKIKVIFPAKILDKVYNEVSILIKERNSMSVEVKKIRATRKKK